MRDRLRSGNGDDRTAKRSKATKKSQESQKAHMQKPVVERQLHGVLETSYNISKALPAKPANRAQINLLPGLRCRLLLRPPLFVESVCIG